MIDNLGRWIEEKDYSTFPKDKWCDCDYMAAWIRKENYEPKTSMGKLIDMILNHYEAEMEDRTSEFDIVSGNFKGTYTNACIAYVCASGGIKAFDYDL